MDNIEFCKLLGRVFFSNPRPTEGFVLNPTKNEDMLRVVNYCEDLCKKTGATVEYDIKSKEDCMGEISIRFTNDLVIGDDKIPLQGFIDVLSTCDAICINGTGLEDGSFCISFFVDNLFIKPDEK